MSNELIQPAAIPAEVIQAEPREVARLYRIAVIAMAVGVVLAILGGIVLAYFDKALPDYVIALASVLAGGLISYGAENR